MLIIKALLKFIFSLKKEDCMVRIVRSSIYGYGGREEWQRSLGKPQVDQLPILLFLLKRKKGSY